MKRVRVRGQTQMELGDRPWELDERTRTIGRTWVPICRATMRKARLTYDRASIRV